MEKWDARPFLHSPEYAGRNIVELESHRYLRNKVNELIQMTMNSSTAQELRQELAAGATHYGSRFSTQLVRAIVRSDQHERQAVIWLLTQLNDQETIPQLQKLSHNKRLARAIRLSASLALAGMGATREMTEIPQRRRMYAIS